MPVTQVDYSPLTDDFEDLYESHNNNADEQVVAGSVLGYNLVLNKYGGGNITIPIPASEDKILTGLSTSIIGFTINYTGGTYQIGNNGYTILAGSQPIPAADPTFDRLDVLAVDTSSNSVYLAGTPSATPAKPTLLATQLEVTTILVPAAGVPTPAPDPDCCVVDGTSTGQTLVWNNGTMAWEVSPYFNTTATLSTLSGSNRIVLNAQDGGGETAQLDLNTNTSINSLSWTSGANSAILTFGDLGAGVNGFSLVTGGEIRLLSDGGVTYKSLLSAPGTVTNKLYNVGGTLYWNGTAVCLAPCGSGGTVPTGTVNYSTLRWDTGGAEYLENVFNRFNDGIWTTILYGETISTPTVGNACILYASVFKGTAVFDINANASVALASGTDDITPVFVNHSIPTLGTPHKGYNALLGTFRCNIVLDSQIGGAVIIASDQGVINKSTSDLGAGFSSLLAVKNCSINQSIDYNLISASQGSQVNYGSRCAIIGSTSCLFTSSATNVSNNCLIESSLSSEIRTYSSGVAVKQSERCHISSSQNSVIRGATNTEMTATQSSTIKSHGASTTTYSQLCNLVSMQSCFNCTIQQTSILHFSSMYAVNMLASDTCEIDTNDSNLNSFALVGCKNTTLTLSDNITSSAFIGCTGLAIAQTTPVESAVVLGYKASHGLTELREYTTYVPSLEIKEGILITSENITAGSGGVPNFVHRIIVTASGQTQTLSSAPYDGETHKIISAFAGALFFTTVDGNGKNISGNATINVPGDYGCVTLEFSAAMDEWYIVAKTY